MNFNPIIKIHNDLRYHLPCLLYVGSKVSWILKGIQALEK